GWPRTKPLVHSLGQDEVGGRAGAVAAVGMLIVRSGGPGSRPAVWPERHTGNIATRLRSRSGTAAVSRWDANSGVVPYRGVVRSRCCSEFEECGGIEKKGVAASRADQRHG